MLDEGPEERAGPEACNPFGYIDHSGFRGFGVDLAYGRLPDGTHVHISKVARGLACNCACPACGKRLIARKGEEKAEHFAHQGEGCGRGAETNAHIWAKDILAEALRIKLPTVKATAGNATREVRKADFFDFVMARLEQHMGDIVPDVILTTASGKELLVEVFVTHRCDAEKIGKLQSARLASVEIDLRQYRQCDKPDVIAKALLESADRTWLFNERQEQESEKLRLELLEAEDREKRRKLEQARREAAALQKRVEAVLQAARAASRKATSADRQRHHDVYDERVNIPIAGEGFIVPLLVWQSAIQDRFLKSPIALSHEHGGLTKSTIMSGIEDCIDPAFRGEPRAELRKAVRAAQPDFRFPDEAIDHYLIELAQQGYLEPTGFADHYALSDEWASSLKAAEQRKQALDRRQGAVDRSLQRVLTLVPEAEQTRFSIDYWFEQSVESFDLSPQQMILAGSEAWMRFDRALLAIETMLADGDPVELTLGLPITDANARASARQQEQVALKQEARRATLRAEARRLLFGDGLAWLSKPSPEGEGSTIEFAAHSDENLKRAIEHLRLAFDRREAEARKKVELASVQQKLRLAVNAIYNPERAALWLESTKTELGMSPQDYCVNEATLHRCLYLLPRKVQRHEAARRR